MQAITQDEKIDYIYETLKKNEKKARWALLFKWGFRVFIIGYMYYFITVGLPLMMGSMIPNMPNFSENSINTQQIQDVLGEYFSK